MNGCAQPGTLFAAGDEFLSTVRVGEGMLLLGESCGRGCRLIVVVATSTSSSTSSTAIASATPSNSAPPSNSSSTPVGAIAGGVVGGVVGLALIALLVWFVMRRKRKTKAADLYALQETHATETTKYRQTASPILYEAEGLDLMQAELPALRKPVELPAEQRAK
jgi:hypothetical protein